MSSALHRLTAAYEQSGHYEQAQSFARRRLELEPWDEVTHQQLMRALALNGQRSAALAHYGACRRSLAKELGVEPDAETTKLYGQIRDGELKAPMPFPAQPPALTAQPPAFLGVGEPLEAERSIFVARKRELARLDGYLNAALGGQGRVVFVTGDGGSDKTTLVQDFHRAPKRPMPA